jgi:hypothetical protein
MLYRIQVEDAEGKMLLDEEKESKWSHERMSAWLQRKYAGRWKSVSVKSV